MRATWLWTALTVIVLAGGSYGLYLWLRPQPLPEQLLYGNGRVEGTEVRIAAEVSGLVVESKLSEGRTVARGDLLVRIDDTELRLRRARAEAEIESLRSERERTERELQVWRHHKLTAETDLARYRELREKGTVTPQRLEQAENAAKEAAGRVAALEAQISSIEARVVAARRELDVLDFQLGKTRVLSPINATVIAKAVEAGEFVQPGRTLAVLVDLSGVELKVYLPEKDIGKVKLDAPARVRVDAFPGRLFDARVATIDQQAQFTPRDIHMPEERVRMVFGVKLAVENRDGALKPGMPADAWILWRSHATWPERLFVPR
ncbi:MAG: HlyD family secretion protein [Pseudorhodoplanes sp.]|nr:HlyD family secretion protein [Pseudorhodoplanes sp.]